MLLKPQSTLNITRVSSQDLAVVVSRHLLLVNYIAPLAIKFPYFRTLVLFLIK